MNADEQASPLAPGLYVVGTPIGNLADISPRALDALRRADMILAEDTRHTRKLLTRYDIHTHLVSCHKFNEARRADDIVQRLASGAVLALVSDSGMPGVSDPGARVVAACREAGHRVYVVPGPSAVTAAISLCGFADAGFLFGGFLPHKSGARRRRLEELLAHGLPVVLFESPFRAVKLLTELQEVAPDSTVFVGRELTKKFEESLVGTPQDMLQHFATRSTKGEWVLVVKPPLTRTHN